MKLRGCLCALALIVVNLITISAKQYGSLTFVIDDSDSMGAEINQVKGGAKKIMDIVLHSNISQVQDIVLVTFNDPVTENKLRIKTRNEAQLTYALNSITVGGGGNCPEYSMSGLYLALEQSYANSFVFVFTDATPRDYSSTFRVKKRAQEKSCTVFFFVTKAPYYCQRLDPVENFKYYHEIADATSGQVFYLDKSDIDEVLAIIRFIINGDQYVIDSDTFPANEIGYVTFNVDDQTEYVLISTSGRNVFIDIEVGPTRNYERVTWIANAKAIKLVRPKPGSYTVKVKSGSTTKVLIYGKTDFTFHHGFSLNEASSLEETTTQPTDGIQHYLAISVQDPRHTVNIHTVRILDMNHKILQEFPLRLLHKDFYTTDAFVPPGSMFLIEVEGEGIQSKTPIKRIAKTPIEPVMRQIVPVINISGTKSSYEFNSDVSLECKVTAYPVPTIVWKDDDGNVIPSQTTALNTYEHVSHLRLSKVKRTQAYYCAAENSLGATSQNVWVTVPSPFIVQEVPKDTTSVEYDKEAVLNCKIRSAFPIQIRWLRVVGTKEEEIRDFHKYSVSSDGTQLKIMKMNEDLEGKYTCKAVLIEDNSFESKHSTQVVIHKIVPTITSIEKTPGPHDFKSDVTLTCKVKGYPTPSIVWKDKAGNTIPSEATASDAYESVSDLKVAKIKRSQKFYCEAKNFAGTVHRSIDVTVNSPFSVHEVPQDTTIVEYGKEAVLHCNIKSAFPIQIRWLRTVGASQEEIKSSDKYTISPDGSQLKIKTMKVNLQGKYTCDATLIEDKSFDVKYNTVVKINGLEVPEIEKQPSVITTKEGKNISIKCKILKSHPKAVLSWRVMKNERVILLRETSEELVINNTTLDDAGKYKCIATNEVGEATQTVEVVVEAPPKIISSNENAYTAVTSDVALRLPCKVTGYPKPTITWKVNDSVVTTGDKYDIDNGDLINSRLSENDDYNKYTCKAENVFGKDEKRFYTAITTDISEGDRNDPAFIFIPEGKSKRISCRHTASETVKWYREGKYMNVIGTLDINNAQANDRGNYSCRVSSRLETRTQNYVVDVGHPPVFKIKYSDTPSQLDWDGSRVKLDCNIDAQPAMRTVKVEWEHNGKVLKEQSNVCEVIGWGNYTCRVSNNYGMIQASFHVTSTGCLVHKNPRIANTPLLLKDGKTMPPNFGTNEQYLVLKSSENIHLFCHDQPKRHNSFQTFPDKTEIVATCKNEDKFLVGNTVYNFRDLQCKDEVLPNLQFTGEKCWYENSEKIKVNFEVDGESRDVYEVCFNKVEKTPIYTKLTIRNPFSLGVVPEASWQTYPEFGVDDEAKYNCAEKAACCFAKTQLVNAQDLTYGPVQTASFINHLNSVPYLRPCDKHTTSLEKVENKIREGLIENSELTVWSGASNYTNKAGLMVPRYLWKVIKTPDGEMGIIVYVNDPSPTTEDILCKDECQPPYFLSDIYTKYTYSCCLEEFAVKFGMPEKALDMIKSQY